LAADFTGDGQVNNKDLEILAADWLNSGLTVEADADLNSQVDFNDYAFLANEWEHFPTEMLISSIESQQELNNWWSAEGPNSLSTDHVTDGTYSLKIDFGPLSQPEFEFMKSSSVDVSQFDKIKMDVYLEGSPMFIEARFWQSGWAASYRTWSIYLIKEGHQTIEYSIPGLASEMDTAQLFIINFTQNSAYVGTNQATIYIDNLRATRGPNDDSWLENPPGKPLITIPGNVLENGDFELGLHKWGAWGNYDGDGVTNYIFGSGSGDNAKSGIYSGSIICIVPGGRGGTTKRMTLEPGEDYEFRFWVKASGAGANLKYWFSEGVSSGGDISYFTVPTGWTEKVYTITASSTDAKMYFFSTGINTVYIDAVSIAKLDGTGGFIEPPPAEGPPRIVTVDGQNILVDGEPFFPIGIWGGVPSELGDTGFNFTTGGTLDECEQYGLMTCVSLSGVARGHAPAQVGLMAGPLKNHPAILFWYNCDEPDHGGYNVPPPEIRFMSKKLEEIDANHPTASVMMPWANSNMYQYADTVDIPMIDPYSEDISRVLEQIDVQRDAAGPDKPIGTVLLGCYGSEKTPEYLYACAYGAVTHTSNGIYWFSYHPDDFPATWSTIVDISLELEDLSPALVSDTSPLLVSVSDPDVDTILKEYDGDLYLIAINTNSAANNVDLTVSGVTATSAQVKFESRTEPIVSGTITDNFTQNQRHVYVFTAP
ncbi:MAG: carbohydrate binding domain-containing protein, partial [Planctomycetota bacterium]